ncbi:hypothetical protein [Arenimonas fontis]|uniref:Uncharacterized protein n=1 Tax=Arenimonas fontis TaxID=2608255 RepID=A0A5B2ZG38_9GAMM|nr:hypothetical protein [Arenimonas fontis]KAA2286022.1 hypothetical protein F0415_00510 [Arenimonas fontis]
MRRWLVAAVLGGIVVFSWGFLSHVALPLGDVGHYRADREEPILQAMRENLPREGVYILPGLDPEQWGNPEAEADYVARARANPYAMVIYQPVGRDGLDMTRELLVELVSNLLAAGLVAWVLGLGTFGFGRRVAISTGMGLFGWLMIGVPYWNWYRFPLDFTLAGLVQHVAGWSLAGLAMAWWLGRKGG